MQIITVPVTIISILICCSTYSYIPTAADLSNAKTNWPEMDSISLFNAYSIYKNKCGSCHFLYRPEQYQSVAWDTILLKMKPKAHLTNKEMDLIKIYVDVHNRKTLPQAQSLN
jgi:hypothetical protein